MSLLKVVVPLGDGSMAGLNHDYGSALRGETTSSVFWSDTNLGQIVGWIFRLDNQLGLKTRRVFSAYFVSQIVFQKKRQEHPDADQSKQCKSGTSLKIYPDPQKTYSALVSSSSVVREGDPKSVLYGQYSQGSLFFVVG